MNIKKIHEEFIEEYPDPNERSSLEAPLCGCLCALVRKRVNKVQKLV